MTKEKINAKVDTTLPGVVTILTVQDNGEGRLLHIETAKMPGRGEFRVSGNIGWDMSQSARAALSYVRSRAAALGITDDFTTIDVHIHAPHMAWHKDGASAGTAITTAFVSLFTNRPIRPGVCMTGEVTLTGGVLPVGGIKGKLTAAWEAGFTDIIMSAENAEDLEKLPGEILAALQIHLVESMDDVLPIAFGGVGAAMLHAIKKEKKEEGDMSEFLKKCAAGLGLAENAAEDQVLEAIRKNREKVGEFYKALGLSAEATVDDMVKAVRTLEAKASDRKGFVPEEHYQAQSKRVEALEAEVEKLKADGRERDFKELIAANSAKVTPAMMEWAQAYFEKDPEGFREYLANAPEVIPLGQTQLAADEIADPSLRGKNVDPVVLSRHQRALKIQDDKGISYSDAMKQVLAAGGK